MIYADGSKHAGLFTNGVPNGKGKSKTVDGVVEKGVWVSGVKQ